jgi:hypothetical protein
VNKVETIAAVRQDKSVNATSGMSSWAQMKTNRTPNQQACNFFGTWTLLTLELDQFNAKMIWNKNCF